MNFSNLKVGDKVAVVYPGFGFSTVTFHPVEKINKQTIKVAGTLYWKDSGGEKGGRWTSTYLETLENGLKLKAENDHQRKLARVNSAIKILVLESSPELVNELLSIIDRYK